MMFKQLTTFLTVSTLLLPAALAAPADLDARKELERALTFHSSKACYGGRSGFSNLGSGALVMVGRINRSFQLPEGLPEGWQLDVSVTDDLDHWEDATEEVLQDGCKKIVKSYTKSDMKRNQCMMPGPITCYQLREIKDD
ncbi:uncharacterized protein BDV14DRAFT_205038 [Aspergillus stella-maris]|uniref:uncharacterized protein n=1 Tax=Aspergillus stella-maris TaxID=1810926 RepID=UPI003CCDB24D